MSTTDQAVSARPEVLEAIIGLQREIAESGLGLDPVMTPATVRAQELTEADGAPVEMVDGDRVVSERIGAFDPADGRAVELLAG
jgi:hypothetical protein